MTARQRAFAADESLAESRLAQHELEDLLALPEDFVPVGDEEKGVTLSFASQSLEVEGRDPGLARAGGGDDEIAAMPALALGPEQSQPRVTHERAQEIDAIGARDFSCDLARNLDIASSVDEKAGSAEGGSLGLTTKRKSGTTCDI